VDRAYHAFFTPHTGHPPSSTHAIAPSIRTAAIMAYGYSNRNHKPTRRAEEDEEVKDPEQREQQHKQQKQQRPPAKAPPLDLSALGISILQYVLGHAWSWGGHLVAISGWWEVGVVLFSFLVLPWFFKYLLGLVTSKLTHILTDALPSALPRAVAGDGNPAMLKDWLVEGAIGMLPVQAQGVVRKVLEALKA